MSRKKLRKQPIYKASLRVRKDFLSRDVAGNNSAIAFQQNLFLAHRQVIPHIDLMTLG